MNLGSLFQIYCSVLVTICCSCNTYKPIVTKIEISESCIEFRNFLNENWLKEKKKGLYKCNDSKKFMKVVNNTFHDCISKITFDELKGLLGSPSLIDSSNIENDEMIIYYWLSEECLYGDLGTRTHSKSDKICTYLLIQTYKNHVIGGPAFWNGEIYPKIK